MKRWIKKNLTTRSPVLCRKNVCTCRKVPFQLVIGERETVRRKTQKGRKRERKKQRKGMRGEERERGRSEEGRTHSDGGCWCHGTNNGEVPHEHDRAKTCRLKKGIAGYLETA